LKRKIFSVLIALMLVCSFSLVTAVPVAATTADYNAAVIKAADRIVSQQNNDDSFDWRFDGDPTVGNTYNTQGITAMGILKAYKLNPKSDYRVALAKLYSYVEITVPIWEWDGTKWKEAGKGVDSFPDVTFLIDLANVAAEDTSLLEAIQGEVSGTTAASIAQLAKERWDNRVSHLGSTTETPDGTATTMAEFLMGPVANRPGKLAFWDLEAGVKAALALETHFTGYRAQALAIADVMYYNLQSGSPYYFNTTDTTIVCYTLALSGAIEAFSELEIHSDMARTMTDLLIAFQDEAGYWDESEVGDTVSVQSTAYAVMALVAQGDTDALVAAQSGSDWLVNTQDETGGWDPCYFEATWENLEVDSEAAWALVAMEEADPMATYEMHFEGALTVEGGIYSGMIPMIKAGGFNVYAREGASAWFGNDEDDWVGVLSPVWNEVAISNHDAYPDDPVDTPDWYQYSLRFYEEEGVQKWRVANHSGAAELLPWSAGGGSAEVEQGVPMSGFMDWDNAYAFETDAGEYLPPIDPLTHPEIPGGAKANGGGAACWDMDWSWGSEVVPLQHPGFEVTITGSDPYSVTLTPAPYGVINKALLLPADWSIVSPDREVTDYHIAYEVELVYAYGTEPSTGERGFIEATGLDPITPVFIKMTDGGWVGFTYAEISQGIFTTKLEVGWNLIGIPETEATAKAILSPIRLGANNERALATLVSQGDYNPSGYSFYESMLNLEDEVPTLYPFDGYWAYMNVAKEFGVVVVE